VEHISASETRPFRDAVRLGSLWDGSTGQPRQVYQGSMRPLADATLTSDGLVMAGDADGLLRFWDRDSGRQLWSLHALTSLIGSGR
jgi:hypothetical protein